MTIDLVTLSIALRPQDARAWQTTLDGLADLLLSLEQDLTIHRPAPRKRETDHV